jgi:NAD(P)-dependent dehydrogenase (short-subunit alcohol dehydrogenase family)
MTNLFDLSGRVAVVTGGNGGSGLGIAEGLAAHGCSVF